MNKKIIYIFCLVLFFCVAVFYAGNVFPTSQESLPEEELGAVESLSSLPNLCQTDDDCVWYEETQGESSGQVHCSDYNYSKTCKFCRILDGDAVINIPKDFRCICNSESRCQEENLKCEPDEYLKQCKRGPCCCPIGALCD